MRDLHQAHDWNIDRFWKSFELILLHQRGATIVLALGLGVVALCAVLRRRLPPAARALLAWAYIYADSTVVGAIGWGTQYAHYNAYTPALLHGAIAAGLVVPAVLACVELVLGEAYAARNETLDAVEAYRRALSLAPDLESDKKLRASLRSMAADKDPETVAKVFDLWVGHTKDPDARPAIANAAVS